MTTTDSRNAGRIAMNTPMLIESIGQPEMQLHENLAKVYSRVSPSSETGDSIPGVLRDLSTNGAFVAGEPLPLLSRIACSFELDGFGRINAIGWTLWRRAEDCEIPQDGGDSILLPKGFGILFEAIPLDARMAIHRLVQSKTNRAETKQTE